LAATVGELRVALWGVEHCLERSVEQLKAMTDAVKQMMRSRLCKGLLRIPIVGVCDMTVALHFPNMVTG